MSPIERRLYRQQNKMVGIIFWIFRDFWFPGAPEANLCKWLLHRNVSHLFFFHLQPFLIIYVWSFLRYACSSAASCTSPKFHEFKATTQWPIPPGEADYHIWHHHIDCFHKKISNLIRKWVTLFRLGCRSILRYFQTYCWSQKNFNL